MDTFQEMVIYPITTSERDLGRSADAIVFDPLDSLSETHPTTALVIGTVGYHGSKGALLGSQAIGVVALGYFALTAPLVTGGAILTQWGSQKALEAVGVPKELAFLSSIGLSMFSGYRLGQTGSVRSAEFGLKSFVVSKVKFIWAETQNALTVPFGVFLRGRIAPLGEGGFVSTPNYVRQSRVLIGEPGANITPRSVALKYGRVGKGGRTYVTDAKAITDVIGPVNGSRMVISPNQARLLEKTLGLNVNSLESRNMLYIIENVAGRAPASPLKGNTFFQGGGKGLPGDGPELTISGINSAGADGVHPIVLEVR